MAKQNMLTATKRIISLLLVMCMVASIMIIDVKKVHAASVQDKFTVYYDTSKYDIYWMARRSVTCYSQYGSMWSDLDEDDKLGSATIRTYYLKPKYKTGDKYYGKVGCQITMNPVSVAGDVVGMSQLAKIQILTPNSASRVCSPTVSMLQIQESQSSNKSGQFTAGTGIKYNLTNKIWEISPSVSLNTSWGSTSTYTYSRTNVNLTQRTNDNGFATWMYDYKSKDGNSVWNGYLHSSSNVAGQVVYLINGSPSGNWLKLGVGVKYEVRFGAGNEVTGDVANRMGVSTNRDMSIETDSYVLSY